MNTEDPCDAPQNRNRWISFTALDASQMAHGDVGVVGQNLLAKATLTAQPLDVAPDNPLPVHPR